MLSHAWLAWALIWGAWSAIAVNGRATPAERMPYADVGAGQAVAVAGLLALVWPGREAPRGPGLFVTLALLGLLASIGSRAALGSNWSGDARTPETIVNEGPYAITRHPIYWSVGVAAGATAVATRDPKDAIGAALIAIGLTMKAAAEDQGLARWRAFETGRGERVVTLDDYR